MRGLGRSNRFGGGFTSQVAANEQSEIPRYHLESGANVIDELQRGYDDLKRRANELRSFL